MRLRRFAPIAFALIAASPCAAWNPLHSFRAAEHKWNVVIVEPKIVFEHLPYSCFGPGSRVAETRFATNEIVFNSACHLQSKYLDLVMLHEVGHLIKGAAHSEDPQDIMYYQVQFGQEIK